MLLTLTVEGLVVPALAQKYVSQKYDSVMEPRQASMEMFHSINGLVVTRNWWLILTKLLLVLN
jgi:hypothetical protein